MEENRQEIVRKITHFERWLFASGRLVQHNRRAKKNFWLCVEVVLDT
jgi:hypothetical protein